MASHFSNNAMLVLLVESKLDHNARKKPVDSERQ